MTRPPPTWRDVDSVVKRVKEEIEEAEREEERLFYTHYLPEMERARAAGRFPNTFFALPPDWRRSSSAPKFKLARQRAAIEAAVKRGDGKLLADLIRPISLDDEMLVNQEVEGGLAPETWDVIAKIITGELDLRKIRGRGRRKKTAEERRAQNPVHDAEDEVPNVELILTRLYYPSRTKAAIRKRAIEVAAKLTGARPETLKRHMRRSKGDRRRLG
jgi:hypothetical protein